jgi:hypothetical protein
MQSADTERAAYPAGEESGAIMQSISPNHKAIQHYYAELATYRGQGVAHELALKTAFQTLLQSLAPIAGWTLVPEMALASGKRPDATLLDDFRIPCGYWEAKDPGDDLAAEIRKKISIGYPIRNTIFENTERAVLYQDGKPAFEADLTQSKQLADLLNLFFHHSEPIIEGFHQAVAEFRERIPELAEGLRQLIAQEHAGNEAFRRAFAGFYALCATSLDPNIKVETIYDMLVQHLLTERLFRTVFNNPDFTQRNVIAREIETVIRALTSRAFDRVAFQAKLDRFYRAVEEAAKDLKEWSEKQAFVNNLIAFAMGLASTPCEATP